MIAWWVLGCPKPAAPPVEPVEVGTTPSEMSRSTVIGPRYWTEPGGLCLEIPDGWTGTTGEPPMVLDITQADTGFGFQIRTWAVDAEVPPRTGFQVSFEDPGGFRTVPILAPGAATRTWQSEDPTGPTLQAWYGELGGRNVEIAARFPLGRITEGREVVDPLLRGVCTTWR